jgi:heme-degrading monooxygenase HmoA
MWLRRTRMDISIELSASVVHQVRVISRCGRRRTRSAPLCARVDRARALRTDPCHHAAENASAYHRHATERVFPALNEIPGHRGAYLLMRQTDDQVEFLAVTLWDSIESIRQFATDDVDRAVVEPEARAVLSNFDDFVRHYEVAEAIAPQCR